MATCKIVRACLEAEFWADYFAVEVDNRESRTAKDDDISAADDLREQYPKDRIQIMRVGLVSAGYIGGGLGPREGFHLTPKP